MLKQKKIANTWDDEITIYDNPYVKTYADRIDFDKYFWFFEEKNLHKYGISASKLHYPNHLA